MNIQTLRGKYRPRRIPPAYTWALMIGGVVLAAFFTRWLIHHLLLLSNPFDIIVGALIDIGIFFPIIYYLYIRPLSDQLKEIKKVEAQMRLQSTALETSKNGVVITDKKGNILWVNPAFTLITGYSSDEVVGQNPRILKSGKQDEAFYDQLWDTILSGQTWLGRLVNKRKDGSLYNEEQVIAPSLDENGEITHFIGVKQDITELVQTEMQLENTIQEHRILSEVEKNHQELVNGLAQATQALREGQDIEIVLDRIFEQARRIIPFLGATLGLLDEHNILHMIRTWGFETRPEMHAYYENVSFDPDDFPILVEMSRSLQPALVDNTELEPEWVVVPGLEWVRTNLLSPLIIDGKMIGIVNMMDDKPSVFTPEMIDRITAFSVPAAIAIQLTRSFSAEQHARKVADILSAASLALTQSLDIDVVLDRMLEQTQNLVPFDEGCVAFLEDKNHINVSAVRGSEERPAQVGLLKGVLSTKDWPHIKRVLATRKTLLIHNTLEYPGWKPFFGLHGLNWLGIPLHFDDNTIGILMIIKTRPNFFTKEHAQLAEALVSQASVAIQNAWLFKQIRSFNERLQYLSRRLVEVQENQLRYVAQELHDEVGQVLTSLILALQSIDKTADQPDAVRAGIVEMGKVLDNVMEDLHRLSMDLHPASLDHLGLEAALRQHLESIQEKFGLETKFEMTKINGRLPANLEITLYRIVQEALTNVIRHARASRADVLIQQRKENLILIVEDNGVGFDPAIAMRGERFGLFGIRERAEMLGGELIIESGDGRGTTIMVEVPYADQNSHRG